MSALLWILAKIALVVMVIIVLLALAWVLLLVYVLRVESYDQPHDIDEPVIDPDDWDEYGDGGGSPRP